MILLSSNPSSVTLIRIVVLGHTRRPTALVILHRFRNHSIKKKNLLIANSVHGSDSCKGAIRALHIAAHVYIHHWDKLIWHMTYNMSML